MRSMMQMVDVYGTKERYEVFYYAWDLFKIACPDSDLTYNEFTEMCGIMNCALFDLMTEGYNIQTDIGIMFIQKNPPKKLVNQGETQRLRKEKIISNKEVVFWDLNERLIIEWMRDSFNHTNLTTLRFKPASNSPHFSTLGYGVGLWRVAKRVLKDPLLKVNFPNKKDVVNGVHKFK